MSDDYSDDFSRGSELFEKTNKGEIIIDEIQDLDGDRNLQQKLNRSEHNTHRLKQPIDYSNSNNVFIAENPFVFKEPDRYTHWKTVDKVDVRDIIRGDIQQLNTVMNELAFSNFNDPAFVKPTKEGQSALQTLQFSLQYMMFTQSEMVNRINSLHQYCQNGKEQLQQLKKIEKAQKERITKQKKIDRKLNEQALHYEFLIKRFRPDLDPEKLEELQTDISMLQSSQHTRPVPEMAQKSMKETKEKLAKSQKKEAKPKKPKTAEVGVDSQQDFMRDIEDKLYRKQVEVEKLNSELRRIKMSDEGLDEYQAQRVRALTKVMQEVIKDDYDPDRDSVARLLGIDRLLQQDSSRREADNTKRIQDDLQKQLDRERRESRIREQESETRAYEKAKREFEFETRKLEMERKQKEIEENRKKDREWQQKIDQEKRAKKNTLSVGNNLATMSIEPAVAQKQPEKPQPKVANNISPIRKPAVTKKDDDTDDIDEDIDEAYSDSFLQESDTDKEEAKEHPTKLPDSKPSKPSGTNFLNKFGGNIEDIDESGTIDFNLTETGSMADSLIMPLGGKSVKGHISESAKDRAAKIERLTKGKDPFSNYVPEQPEEDEDEISEDQHSSFNF
ncbi:unnamed protein product [Moneuplotes crassus]|uniref:Cilium assembly protein DZIP1 N-terminal domain-containing protein n=1 Tax=Euplotes crassus TaxID=5936 RepID=A0AAD1X8A2_EUPCR|nr:unnamed protein product [Moneuplotes crassus]